MNHSDYNEKNDYYCCKHKDTAHIISASVKSSDYKAPNMPLHTEKPLISPIMKSPASIIHPKYPVASSLPLQSKKPAVKESEIYKKPASLAATPKNTPDPPSSREIPTETNLTQKKMAQENSQDEWWLKYDQHLSKILK